MSQSTCLQNLYPVGKDMWVGKTTDGNFKQFKNIPEYRDYLFKLSSAGHVCPDVSIPLVSQVEKAQLTPFTGFMEFKPKNPQQQAKYSAMSPYWVGTDETIRALEYGYF